jgi:hypothetical protein
MKHTSFLVFVAIFAAQGISAHGQGIDLGLKGGAAFFSGAYGFSGEFEALWSFGEFGSLSPEAGLSFLYQRSFDSSHAENEYQGFAVGALDWDFLPLVKIPSIDSIVQALQGKLVLRARLALGGGYVEDNASDSAKAAGIGCFALSPSAGLSYDFKLLKAELLVGPEILVASGGTRSALALTLGARYAIDLPGRGK